MRTLMLATALVAATAAAAQNAPTTANPPGNMLAPEVSAPPTMPAVKIVPATGAPSIVAAADKYKTEIVCKTTIETGSLIARHKTCLTRKQWSYVNDENERFARKMVEDNTSRPNGN